MNAARVLALIASVAWVAGNALLVTLAPLIFRHAPGAGGGGGHDFSSHYAAGVVFGDCLNQWTSGVSHSLLPATLVAGIILIAGAVLTHRRWAAVAWMGAMLALTALHWWSVSTVTHGNSLLAQLLSGQVDGEQWRTFRLLHRESQFALSAETVAAVVVAIAAAIPLARRSEVPPP